MDLQDLGDGVAGRTSFAVGAGRIRAATLVVGVAQDALIPAGESAAAVDAINAGWAERGAAGEGGAPRARPPSATAALAAGTAPTLLAGPLDGDAGAALRTAPTPPPLHAGGGAGYADPSRAPAQLLVLDSP
jgi:hypothetical protein